MVFNKILSCRIDHKLVHKASGNFASYPIRCFSPQPCSFARYPWLTVNSDSSLAGYVILLKDVRNSLMLKNADKLNPYIDLKKGLIIYTLCCRCDK